MIRNGALEVTFVGSEPRLLRVELEREGVPEASRDALDDLLPVAYRELREIAHRALAGERPGHTLQTTGLVHEVFLKLAGMNRIEWHNRQHFLAVSARLMRQILIDYAVTRGAKKRGGELRRVPFDESALESEMPHGEMQFTLEQFVALDEALRRLERSDARQGQVVECRFFAGMTVEETAGALNVSVGTVKRDWRLARAWLNRELS